jgi:hypothetical protein
MEASPGCLQLWPASIKHQQLLNLIPIYEAKQR